MIPPSPTAEPTVGGLLISNAFVFVGGELSLKPKQGTFIFRAEHPRETNARLKALNKTRSSNAHYT